MGFEKELKNPSCKVRRAYNAAEVGLNQLEPGAARHQCTRTKLELTEVSAACHLYTQPSIFHRFFVVYFFYVLPMYINIFP